MEIYIFGRFRVRVGEEAAFAEALREVVTASREEAGCVEIHGYRGMRDRRLFYVHSRWRDEEAFEAHARLPHTVRFLQRAEAAIADGLDVTRAERIE
jgi:quinol monooxygenase YgiN